MAEPAFQVRNVQQFTFEANDETLACIYRDIANVNNPALSVNIRAYLQILLRDCKNFVKIVPGVSFGFDFPDVPNQTPQELARVRQVLESYCVKFTEETVLFVSAASVPGQLARVQGIFTAFDIQTIASYIDESTFSIYEVSNNALATQALTLSVAQQDAIIANNLNCNQAGNCRKHRCRCQKW